MISSLVKPENVVCQLESTDKDSLFAELTEVLVRSDPFIDRNEVFTALFEKEEQRNSIVMNGIAVPYVECSSVKSPVLAVGISRAGIDYDVYGVGSRDFADSLVHLAVLFLFDKRNTERKIHVLADCARVLHIPGFYGSCLSAGSAQAVCNIFRDYETSY